MRKPHKHTDQTGSIWDCSNTGCRMPFKVHREQSKPTRQRKAKPVASWSDWYARHPESTY